MRNRFTLLKFYLTVVSLVGVIGLAIGYGVAIYAGIQSAVISDQEYMIGSNMRYQLDMCSQPKGASNELPTDTEIAECEAEANTDMINQRHYNTKQDVIGGLVWGSIALVLFAIHYPMLLKAREED